RCGVRRRAVRTAVERGRAGPALLHAEPVDGDPRDLLAVEPRAAAVAGQLTPTPPLLPKRRGRSLDVVPARPGRRKALLLLVLGVLVTAAGILFIAVPARDLPVYQAGHLY